MKTLKAIAEAMSVWLERIGEEVRHIRVETEVFILDIEEMQFDWICCV